MANIRREHQAEYAGQTDEFGNPIKMAHGGVGLGAPGSTGAHRTSDPLGAPGSTGADPTDPRCGGQEQLHRPAGITTTEGYGTYETRGHGGSYDTGGGHATRTAATGFDTQGGHGTRVGTGAGYDMGSTGSHGVGIGTGYDIGGGHATRTAAIGFDTEGRHSSRTGTGTGYDTGGGLATHAAATGFDTEGRHSSRTGTGTGYDTGGGHATRTAGTGFDTGVGTDAGYDTVIVTETIESYGDDTGMGIGRTTEEELGREKKGLTGRVLEHLPGSGHKSK